MVHKQLFLILYGFMEFCPVFFFQSPDIIASHSPLEVSTNSTRWLLLPHRLSPPSSDLIFSVRPSSLIHVNTTERWSQCHLVCLESHLVAPVERQKLKEDREAVGRGSFVANQQSPLALGGKARGGHR